MRERKRKVEGTLHFWNSGGATSPNRHGNYLRYSLDLDDSDGAATFFLLLLLLLPLPPSLPFKNNCNSIAIKLNSDQIQWNCVRVWRSLESSWNDWVTSLLRSIRSQRSGSKEPGSWSHWVQVGVANLQCSTSHWGSHKLDSCSYRQYIFSFLFFCFVFNNNNFINK